MFERRCAGASLKTIAESFNLSTSRICEILQREEQLERRAAELAEADRRPEQPNPLHLEPQVREKIAKILGKQEFTPKDIENHQFGFTAASFIMASDFRRRDWNALVEWMARAGKVPKAYRKRLLLYGHHNDPE